MQSRVCDNVFLFPSLLRNILKIIISREFLKINSKSIVKIFHRAFFVKILIHTNKLLKFNYYVFHNEGESVQNVQKCVFLETFNSI